MTDEKLKQEQADEEMITLTLTPQYVPNITDEWLEANKIDELRDIINDELMEKVDEKEVKYRKAAIGNIRSRTDTLFNS